MTVSMRQKLWLSAAFIVTVAVAPVGCSKSKSNEAVHAAKASSTHPAPSPDIARVTPQQAAELQKSGKATIVDVREPDEIAEGMAAPAKSLPTSQLHSDPGALDRFLATVPKDQELIFYCSAGGRAGKAAEMAKAKGYTVANMGGYSGWKSAGLPTKTPEQGR